MARAPWRWAQWIGGALVVAFLLNHLWNSWSEVRASPIDWGFHPGWIAASLGLVLTTYALLIESWRRILAGWGPRLGWWESARVWVLSSMGKYIPGKVWAVAGMAMLAQRRGVSPWAATASAVFLQVASLGTGALIVGGSGIAVLEARQPGSTAALAVVIAASIAGLAALLWPPAASRLIRLVAPKGTTPTAPAPGALVFGIGANAAAWVTYGVALWLLARGVLPRVELGLAEAIGAFAASYIAGLLVLLVPGGVGVRESVMVFMLQDRVGLANALALAAVSRIGMTAADVLAVLPFVRADRETARHAT
jgi:hypothetical protein